jgi:hypothetical protein
MFLHTNLIIYLACFVWLPFSTTEAKTVAKGTLQSRGVDAEIPYVVHAGDHLEPSETPFPIVVYLRNLAIPRIGTASDKEIIDGLLEQNLLVAVVDYGGSAFPNDESVFLEFSNLRACFGSGSVYSTIEGRFAYRDVVAMMPFDEKPAAEQDWKLRFQTDGGEYRVSLTDIYVLPEGFTLHRRLELAKNGKAESPAEVHFMDLIVPARPKKPVPVVIDVSTKPVVPGKGTATALNPNSPYVMSYTYFSHAFASIAYVHEMDENGERRFGLHDPESKAIRMLRGRKDEWSLSGKVGIFGISKGSVRSFMAAARRSGRPAPAVTPEMLESEPYTYLYGGKPHGELVKDLYDLFALPGLYEEHLENGELTLPASDQYRQLVDEAEPGPFADFSDRPDVAMAVDFGPGAILQVMPYIEEDLAPLYLGCGLGIIEWVMTTKRKTPRSAFTSRCLKDLLDKRGIKNYWYEEQEELAHEFNYRKYREIKAFFGNYLVD